MSECKENTKVRKDYLHVPSLCLSLSLSLSISLYLSISLSLSLSLSHYRGLKGLKGTTTLLYLHVF